MEMMITLSDVVMISLLALVGWQAYCLAKLNDYMDHMVDKHNDFVEAVGKTFTLIVNSLEIEDDNEA